MPSLDSNQDFINYFMRYPYLSRRHGNLSVDGPTLTLLSYAMPIACFDHFNNVNTPDRPNTPVMLYLIPASEAPTPTTNRHCADARAGAFSSAFSILRRIHYVKHLPRSSYYNEQSLAEIHQANLAWFTLRINNTIEAIRNTRKRIGTRVAELNAYHTEQKQMLDYIRQHDLHDINSSITATAPISTYLTPKEIAVFALNGVMLDQPATTLEY